jgi:transcriptional regulator with XRE-family HTH domain
VAIKQARTDKGMSARQVAEATERLGHKVSRDVLAGYEMGRKLGLDVADLLAVSAGLDVPLLSLLVSGEPDELVVVLPGQPMPVLAAQTRLIGSEPPWVAELRKVTAGLSGHGQLSAEVRKVEEK